MALETKSVQIPLASGGSMGGYFARPAGNDVLPGVLVYMEIFGVNVHIKAVTERIAAEGYVALAPDYFHRTGPGLDLDYDEAGMNEGLKHLGQLQADSMISDAKDAIAFLRSNAGVKGESIGAMGFCIGGHMAYLTACETDVKAAASYYGGGIAAPQGLGGGASTISRTPKISGKIICYFGGKDAMIPGDQVSAVKKALDETGKGHEVILYPEADHGFNCDLRASYNEAASKDSWAKTLALFSKTL